MVRSDDLEATRTRLAQLTPAMIEPLMLTARGHGVEAWLSACLPAPPNAGPDPWQELADQRRRFLAVRARTAQATSQFSAAMTQLGQSWVLLKGAGLARVYPRPDLRYSVDIDALVPPAAFEAVIELLVSDGWQLLDVNWPLLADLVPGEQRLRSPNGTLLDLHWSLFNDRSVRRAFRFDTDDLLARAGARLLLAPVDQLIHTGVHAALAGGNRLCWLVDLDRLSRAEPPDWDQVVVTARTARAGSALALALGRTAAVLDTDLPAGLLRSLAGSGQFAVQRLLDSRAVLVEDPLSPSLIRAVARSRRHGWWRSQLELARHGTGWLTAWTSRRSRLSPWLDPDDETSALYAVDDESAQHSYYKAVVDEADRVDGGSMKTHEKHTGVRP